jgi:hypothetical protein
MNPEMMFQSIGFAALLARKWLFILAANQKVKLEAASCRKGLATTFTYKRALLLFLLLLVFFSYVESKLRGKSKHSGTEMTLQRL